MKRKAFTLIELLVVIGIIAILIGILLPVLSRVQRQANRSRIAGDMNAIGNALEAYKQDFGDYPRVGANDTGFAILGFALIGPGPAVGAPVAYDSNTTYAAGAVVNSGGVYVALRESTGQAVSNAQYWAPTGWKDRTNTNPSYGDGADGPGFRVTYSIDSDGDGIPDQPGGKVWGPYIQPDKFKISGTAILDSYGNPFLYFPANQKISPNQLLVAYPAANITPRYNAFDNRNVLRRSGETDTDVINRMSIMFGDLNLNGVIDNGSSPAETAPAQQGFILWSAGPDGLFGPPLFTPSAVNTSDSDAQVKKCDDVLNNP